jgi:hypothetical protein
MSTATMTLLLEWAAKDRPRPAFTDAIENR